MTTTGDDRPEPDGLGPPPLDGVRVVEVAGGIPAAFATRQLAGFGADVVRVEGHPVEPGLTEDEEVYLVAGKRRVEVSGDDLLRVLLAADIVVEDGAPGALAALGADPLVLRARKPEQVLVSISPFGQKGPYRDYRATNIVSFAMGGIMSITGDFSRPPLVSGGSQAQYVAGLHAFSATVTAYYGVVQHGEGDWIDISAQECAAGMLELYAPTVAYGAPILPRLGNQTRAEWGIYPCADGYIGFFALQRQIRNLFEAMDDPELYDGPFLDPMYRLEHHEELLAKMYVFTADKTKDQLISIGRQHKVPVGAAVTPADLLQAASLTERGFWDRVETPSGEATVPGRPFTGVGWGPPERLHAPGEDTSEVLNNWLREVAR
jgi:crotonobetainyl-CoA:carnitine CoA-transferase CaiB-like acyl-CoA transferase